MSRQHDPSAQPTVNFYCETCDEGFNVVGRLMRLINNEVIFIETLHTPDPIMCPRDNGDGDVFHDISMEGAL